MDIASIRSDLVMCVAPSGNLNLKDSCGTNVKGNDLKCNRNFHKSAGNCGFHVFHIERILGLARLGF